MKIIIFFERLFHIRYKYLFMNFSYVYVDSTSTLSIGKDFKIWHSKIHLKNHSVLNIDDGVSIKNTVFSTNCGIINIGNNSVLENGKMPTRQYIVITDGYLEIGSFNRIRCCSIWIRFKGKLLLSDYININEFSEVRCDENISIGEYTEISYYVNIWDTNTHEFEPYEQRRERWRKLFLKRDVSSKPITSPISIGTDCWIGEKSSILKGCSIGNRCIIGYSTMLSNAVIPNDSKVVNEIKLKYIKS